MLATPAAARRLVEEIPGLLLREERRGDLLEPQTWGAVLGPEGSDGQSEYRYMLWRIFDPLLPILVVLMLNPSGATHSQGDRTVDGLVRRARRLGYGGILVVNCFAWRAKDPSCMRRAPDPVGPANDRTIELALDQEVDLLCAWGTNATHLGREEKIRCLISEGRARPHWLRLCAGGAPEHPLYLPYALTPTPWDDMRQNA